MKQLSREVVSWNQVSMVVADSSVEPSHAMAEHASVYTNPRTGDKRAAVQALWFHVQLPMASLGMAAGVASQASARRLRGAPLLNLLHQRAASAAGAL